MKLGIESGRVDVARGVERRGTALNEVLHQIAEAVLVFDRELHITYINAAFQRVLGYAPEDVIGKPLSILSVPGQPDPLQPAEIARRVNEVGGWHGKVLRRAKDGSAIPFMLSASVVRDKQGGITGYVGTYLDLRESRRIEQRYQSLIEHSSDVIALLSHVGTVLYVSPSAQRVFGHTPTALLGTDIFALVHPDDLSDAHRVFTEVLQNRERAYHVELRVRHAEGGYVDTETVGRNLLNDPAVAGVIINVRDITDRKRVEVTMREREQDLDAIVENLPLMIFVKDAQQLRFVRFNRAGEELLGKPRASMIGKSDRDFFPPEQAEFFIAHDHETLRRGEIVDIPIEPINTPRGRRLLHTRKVTVRGSDGQPRYLLGISEDITDRKQSEDKLAASEVLLRQFIQHAPAAIAMLDTQMCYIQTSERWMRDYRLSDRDIIGKSHYEVFPEIPQRWKDIHQRVLAGAVERCDEDALLRADGSTDWLQWEVIPWRKPAGEIGGLIIFSQVITERKQTQAALLKNAEYLKATLTDTIGAIARTVEQRDPYTAGHQNKVSILCVAIGSEMKLSEDRIEGLRLAALIHDIGKIYIPAEILNRPGKLTAPEFEMIKTHPQIGYDIIKDVKFPWPVAQIILQHHERLDGTGYPRGLKGEAILLEARILTVADVVEAMSSHRPYRPELGPEAALAEITAHRGTRYDADVVDASMRLFKEKGFTLNG